LIFISRTERTSLHEGLNLLGLVVCNEIFGPLGAFGCDDDPFFRQEILA
jgi:hypothetical protein